MADFVVRYADFKGGDYGVLDPARADADTFHGVNVYPYRSGLLGVRAGAKQLEVFGLPNHTHVPGPVAFWAFGSQLVVIIGDKPYAFHHGGGAAAPWAAYPSTPILPVRFLTGKGIPYSIVNGTLYKHATAASTTPITTPAPLSMVVRWGYFFVGVDRNIPWRLWFSDLGAGGPNFDSWPPNNYLDIGDTEAITALVPIFNTLYVGKIDGWRAVSGILGTLASVRAVTIGNGPIDQRLTASTTDNRVVYWPKESSPAWFNGERVSLADDQERDGIANSPCDTVIVTPTSQRVILASRGTNDTNLLSYSSSAWTRHNFPHRLAGMAPGQVQDGDLLPADVIYAVIEPTIVGVAVRVLTYHHNLDRPGHASDQYASPSDVGSAYPLVTGNVTFPAYWEPIGRQVRVRSVIVQFRKWPSGVSGTLNELHLRVNALGAYAGGPTDGTEHHWSEPCERVTALGGADDSWRVNVGGQGYGNGFQIEVTKIVGVALREIVLLCDVRTERV